MTLRTALQREHTGALFSRVYQELHAVARQCLRHERRDHTLQATALVHEAFLQLTHAAQQPWVEPQHLLALGARAIRRVLVNHARARRSKRRGAGRRPLPLPDMAAPGLVAPIDLLALADALDELEQLDARQAQIIELRFFGGLDTSETARVLGVSSRTIEGEWALARAWLRQRMCSGERSKP
jgi:RNA polymerase sigma-70 factor, ECF subfamily